MAREPGCQGDERPRTPRSSKGRASARPFLLPEQKLVDPGFDRRAGDEEGLLRDVERDRATADRVSAADCASGGGHWHATGDRTPGNQPAAGCDGRQGWKDGIERGSLNLTAEGTHHGVCATAGVARCTRTSKPAPPPRRLATLLAPP